mgnify:CR=1 FL=1
MSETKTVSKGEIRQLAKALGPLIGCQLDVLKLPRDILAAFEPSQIGTIVGTLMDACTGVQLRTIRRSVSSS